MSTVHVLLFQIKSAKFLEHFVMLCTTEHHATISLHTEGGVDLVLGTEN